MRRILKKFLWTIIVAYMVGIHNFYKQDDKTPEDIVIKIEDIETQEDSSPKDWSGWSYFENKVK